MILSMMFIACASCALSECRCTSLSCRHSFSALLRQSSAQKMPSKSCSGKLIVMAVATSRGKNSLRLPPWLRHEVAHELHGVWMRKIPIFMELNVNDLMTVFHHMKSMVVHLLMQGHHIVRQGLPCNACFFVEEGVCQMLKGKTFLGFIKAGSFFSENALHYNQETTRTIEDSSGTSSTSEEHRTGGTGGTETPQEMFNVVADQRHVCFTSTPSRRKVRHKAT